MGRCPRCNRITLTGHYCSDHVRIELELPEDHRGFVPIPFQGNYPGSPGYGKHHMTAGLTCVQNAKEWALDVFPEANITGIVLVNVLGKELHRIL